MNQEDSIIFEITNFEIKRRKAFEEIVRVVWNQEKQLNLGKFEQIFIKIRLKYNDWLEERNIKENPNSPADLLQILEVLTNEFVKSLKYNIGDSNISLFRRDIIERANTPSIIIVLKSNRRFNQYLNKLFDYKEKIKNYVGQKHNFKQLTDLRGFEKKLKLTIKYLILIKKVFSELDSYGQMFLNMIIDKFAIKSANYIKTKLADNFEQLNREQLQTIERIIDELTNKKDDLSIKKLFEKNEYFEIHYEDVIIIIFHLIGFLSGIEVSIVRDDNDHIMVRFYCKDINVIRNIAEGENHYCQLNPYGLIFNSIIKKKKLNRGISLSLTEINHIFNNYFEKNPQLNDLDLYKPYSISPYFTYKKTKLTKFRKYTEKDEFHACKNDYYYEGNNYKCVCNTSEFRNIDKIRLIYTAIDRTISLKNLMSYKLFEGIYILRNYESLKSNFTFDNLVTNKMNIFNFSTQLENLQHLRNFYGEEIGLYFLFVLQIIRWFTIPAFIGIAIYIFTLSTQSKYIILSDLNLTHTILIGYILFMAFWTSIFEKTWKGIQKHFCFIWGVENEKRMEEKRLNYNNEIRKHFLLNYFAFYRIKWRQHLKFFISFLFLLTFSIISILTTFLLFLLKKTLLLEISQNNKDNYVGLFDNGWPLTIAIFNSVQIRIMSFFFNYFSEIITEWENHQKESEYEYSLSLKSICFELINHFNPYFYIIFFKITFEGACNNNNCNQELSLHIYTILITFFLINMIFLGFPFFKLFYKKSEILKNFTSTQISFEPHTIYHQMICDEYKNNSFNYTEILVYFGHITFFSIICPLTTIIVIIIIYGKYFTEIYNFIFFKRMTFIYYTKKLTLYQTLIKLLIFFGLVFNIAVLLFYDQRFISLDIYYRTSTFLVLENFFLIILFTFNYKFLPNWVNNIELIEHLYLNEYYNKSEFTQLPHFELIGSAAMNSERDEKNKFKEILLSFPNKEDLQNLENTANINEDYFDSKSFNFSRNYNFSENNEKNLFVNKMQDYCYEEKQDQMIIELNKHNLPINGFARIIEKQLFYKDDLDAKESNQLI